MSEVEGTCEYVLDPDDPETWKKEGVDRCFVYEEDLDENDEWACPHEAYDIVVEDGNETKLCLFHLPLGEKDDVVDEFLRVVRQAAKSDDPEVRRRNQQFLSAQFNQFDISVDNIELADDHPLDLRHAQFMGGLNFDVDADVMSGIDFSGATFENDAVFNQTKFNDDVNLKGVFIDGSFNFSGTILGGLNLSLAEFKRINLTIAIIEGRVNLDGTTVENNLDCPRTKFRDTVQAQGLTIKNGDAIFTRANLNGIVLSAEYNNTNINGSVNFNNTLNDGGISCPGATIGDVLSFEDATIRGRANFKNVTVEDGATFSDMNFEDAVFHNATIPTANFQKTNLTEADFSHADLRGGNFEQAILSRANLFDADLRGSAFFGSVMGDVLINEMTQFDDCCVYENPGSSNGPTADIEVEERDRLIKAAGQYRIVEQLGRTNAFPEMVSDNFIRRKEIHRRQYKETDSTVRWLQATISKYILQYGENPWRILITSTVVIFVFGVLYPMVGGISVTAKQSTHAFNLPQFISASAPHSIETLLLSIYFSAVTFSTLGYGDIQPTNAATQALAGIESLLGAVLIALLVFVLGRRAAR